MSSATEHHHDLSSPVSIPGNLTTRRDLLTLPGVPKEPTCGMNPWRRNSTGECQLSSLPPAGRATRVSTCKVPAVLPMVGPGWVTPLLEKMCEQDVSLGQRCWGERRQLGGSDVRLALNPQKSPYLEKCSILLLISAFASISLLVCAAAVLLSGREGEAEEGGERTPVSRMLGMTPSQICILLGATSCNPLASSTSCWACWTQAGLQPPTLAQGMFLR